MIERHLQNIDIVSQSMERLKGMIGISNINDAEWEGIAGILDEYAFRLRSAADGIRSGLQLMDSGRRSPSEIRVTHGS